MAEKAAHDDVFEQVRAACLIGLLQKAKNAAFVLVRLEKRGEKRQKSRARDQLEMRVEVFEEHIPRLDAGAHEEGVDVALGVFGVLLIRTAGAATAADARRLRAQRAAGQRVHHHEQRPAVRADRERKKMVCLLQANLEK